AMRTDSWCVFNHFTGVDLWQDVFRQQGGDTGDHPFPCDAAALHHILDDGWAYVLRFDNGVTSAGVLVDGRKRAADEAISPAEEWHRLIGGYPSLVRQFRHATPTMPWMRTRRLQRLGPRAAGDNWADLASSTYTLDALYSPGIAHSMLTVQRLARLLTEPGPSRQGLQEYQRALQAETAFIDRLVHASYQAFADFRLLAAWTMYYFAGAIAAEERRKQGRAGP